MSEPRGTTARLEEITRQINCGEGFEELYAELRRMAQREMVGEAPGRTLQATALVHEAYLRVAGDRPGEWVNRGHFFGTAARAMRRILVEAARRRAAEKRGGDVERTPLDGGDIEMPNRVDMLGLDDALATLEQRDPRLAQVVELRFFAGLTVEDTAKALGSSQRTVKRDWNVARAWLRAAMSDEGS